ncbi:MAG TPA: DNA/RNA non-specific endonuclease [Verrucomicrobiae bacterium]|nr:DNA/RNA non-specific endonuclease [Verrucomicrobiae bacterium]
MKLIPSVPFTKNLSVLIAALSAILCFLTPARATINASLQLQLGNPTGAIVDTNNHSHYLVSRTVESLDYSDSLGEPNWASWDLTAADQGSSGRNSTFYTDTNLPTVFYWVKTGDYTDSGYDRGHMCPSADRTDTTNDNKLVFFMSNIIPQTPDNNEGIWASFEDYCRTLSNSGYEMLIMCGPSGFGTSKINTNGPVYIPGYTWKIALAVPTGSGTALSRVTGTTRVISLNVPNIAGIRSTPWSNFVTAATVIQANTGFNFFTAVATNIAEVLRAKVDGATAPTLTSFSPGSGAAGASVTINGTSFTGASIVKFNTSYATTFTVNSDTKITATVPTGATTGLISVIAPGGLATSASSFTVTNGGGGGGGGGGTTNLTISQVYGGGGNSGATYKNDFIEIYNAGTATVSLSTYAVQYASSTGSTWSETTLSGTIAPGAHYLIQEAAGSGGTTSLPTPEATGTISMAATAGKVALTKTTTLLTVDNPVGTANVVDFVGYGSADAYEGTGAAPAPSNTTSDLRAGGGATDTNDNSADFTAGTVNPRNN